MSDLVADLGRLRVITQEIESRKLRKQKLEVLTYEPTYTKGEHPLVYPGTVTVFLARKDDPVLDQIRAAVKAGATHRSALAVDLYGKYGERRPVSVTETIAQVTSAGVIADVRYGGTSLVERFVLPTELQVGVLALPYNGGRLAPEGFTLAEYVKEGSDEALEALVVVDSPQLTEAERAALELVPEDQWELNIGKVTPQALPVILTVMLVVEFAVTMVACKAKGDTAAFNERSLPYDLVDEIGPAATARELLALRRRALEQIR